MEHSKTFGSFYADASGGEGERCSYPTRLDTYGCGCFHDCRYCYAKSLLDFRKNWNPDKPHVASTSDISKALKKVRGGANPPTRRHDRLLPTVGAHIQISVTSTSDEPNFLVERASLPSDRIRAAQTLQDLGFDVSLRVSPYIPELVDVDVLKASGVRKCLVEFLRVNGFIAKWLEAEGYATSHYAQKSGGYRHLPLWKKQSLLKPFKDFELTVCEDVPAHYKYWKEHVNANPDDCCNLRKETA